MPAGLAVTGDHGEGSLCRAEGAGRRGGGEQTQGGFDGRIHSSVHSTSKPRGHCAPGVTMGYGSGSTGQSPCTHTVCFLGRCGVAGGLSLKAAIRITVIPQMRRPGGVERRQLAQVHTNARAARAPPAWPFPFFAA